MMAWNCLRRVAQGLSRSSNNAINSLWINDSYLSRQVPLLSGTMNFSYSTSTSPLPMPLDEFRDSVDRETRARERVGRPWTVKELRRKSYDDLHKLWLVLYKERNMLLTEENLSRRRGIIMPQPDRRRKVRKSMASIRHVLGERKRVAIREHNQSRLENAGNDNEMNNNKKSLSG